MDGNFCVNYLKGMIYDVESGKVERLSICFILYFNVILVELFDTLNPF